MAQVLDAEIRQQVPVRRGFRPMLAKMPLLGQGPLAAQRVFLREARVLEPPLHIRERGGRDRVALPLGDTARRSSMRTIARDGVQGVQFWVQAELSRRRLRRLPATDDGSATSNPPVFH
jgi:hypothetical protein